MDRDDSLGGEKTKGNLLLGKRSLEKTTISNEGEVNENNPTHNSESIMTSSLQGLRKFRAKENKSNANIEGNNNGLITSAYFHFGLVVYYLITSAYFHFGLVVYYLIPYVYFHQT
jgi:hypothetical protein